MLRVFARSYPLVLLSLLLACGGPPGHEQEAGARDEEPKKDSSAAPSSPAKALARQVIEAMGGMEQWEKTDHLTWNFFGRRTHYWNKKKGLSRIEVPRDSMVLILDLQADTGQVYRGGQRLTSPDSVQRYVELGRKIWANDSYWLCMPFKLLDPGVKLAKLGKDTTKAGEEAEVLEVTFQDVGYTPQNKYHVYIDPETHLVRQWDFYRKENDKEPTMVTPWTGYDTYNGIRLASGRGEHELSGIAAPEKLEESLFKQP